MKRSEKLALAGIGFMGLAVLLGGVALTYPSLRPVALWSGLTFVVAVSIAFSWPSAPRREAPAVRRPVSTPPPLKTSPAPNGARQQPSPKPSGLRVVNGRIVTVEEAGNEAASATFEELVARLGGDRGSARSLVSAESKACPSLSFSQAVQRAYDRLEYDRWR